VGNYCWEIYKWKREMAVIQWNIPVPVTSFQAESRRFEYERESKFNTQLSFRFRLGQKPAVDDGSNEHEGP
jgi:hypothetical protein